MRQFAALNRSAMLPGRRSVRRAALASSFSGSMAVRDGLEHDTGASNGSHQHHVGPGEAPSELKHDLGSMDHSASQCTSVGLHAGITWHACLQVQLVVLCGACWSSCIWPTVCPAGLPAMHREVHKLQQLLGIDHSWLAYKP